MLAVLEVAEDDVVPAFAAVVVARVVDEDDLIGVAEVVEHSREAVDQVGQDRRAVVHWNDD